MKEFFPGVAYDIMAEHEFEDNGHPQPNQSNGRSLTGRLNFPDSGQPPYIQTHQENACQGGYLMGRQFADKFAISRLTQNPVQDPYNHKRQPPDDIFPNHSLFLYLIFL